MLHDVAVVSAQRIADSVKDGQGDLLIKLIYYIIM